MYKKIALSIGGLLFMSSVMAETISSPQLVDEFNRNTNFNHPGVIYTILILAILVLWYEYASIRMVHRKVDELTADPNKPERVTWMALFFRKSSTRDAHLGDHVYDGIQEYDNNPPAWFNWLFYGSIVTAIIYMMYFHVLKIGKLSGDEYKQEMAEAQVVVDKAREAGIKLADMGAYKDPAKINAGKAIFAANCAACHGDKGQGLVGPNLTDNYWLHGGEYKDVFKTIFNGVPNKPMQSWKKILKPEDIREVASYVKSLKGTNPPNPKAPQGTEITEN